MSRPIIRVEHLGKRYRISGGRRAPYRTLRETIVEAVTAPWRRRSSAPSTETIWALRDVSFDVQRGEVVGVIGRNGAGKTTLLKLLARITPPTEGRAAVYGRVGSLLEVGTGFHPELSGRENIYLSGAILGMKRAEIARKFDEIVAFAEVEKFIDTPVKHYSSGMVMRLAFAVAAHLETEILLMDEVLAVGDASFQRKCLGKMGEVAGEGRSVLFVSHNMAAVKSLCSTALWLEQGGIRFQGTASQTADEYLKHNIETCLSAASWPEQSHLRIQLLHAEIAECIDAQGLEMARLKCEYIVRAASDHILLFVEVRNNLDILVFYATDQWLEDDRKRRIGVHTVSMMIPKYLLTAGDYSIALGFWAPGYPPEHFPRERLTFRREEPVTPLSRHGIAWPGVIYMPTRWEYLAADAGAEWLPCR